MQSRCSMGIVKKTAFLARNRIFFILLFASFPLRFIRTTDHQPGRKLTKRASSKT